MGLSDTHPEAERVQIDLLRQATPERRAALALALSQHVAYLAREAIRRAHPGASETEIDLQYVALHYGQDLADRVRAYLDVRRS
jgi:hypothetical protein